ncbi:cyclin-A1 [Salarias fasciatus]|uniref:cyclin-A1 n=1 Tax=Salarias fasciatus TaxID=181472 RepID=UPI00117683D3|nr:cyclin-A1 [Salarias fasciatus]
MNFEASAHHGDYSHKENVPPSSKTDAPHARRTRQRTVLGVLSENEQHSRSRSEGSHFSVRSDSSQLNLVSCPSSSSFDVYVEEACEVVLAASGQEVAQSDALQIEDMRLLLELSSSSYQDASGHSEPESSLLSEGMFSMEYAKSIYQHLRENEVKFRAKPYLQRHPEITSDMRVILVDWLVEVAQEYRLHSETLHLAVNYLDRFLSCTAFMKRGKLQLVGTAALLIAAKYEEIDPPDLNEFVYVTDNTYTKKQLVQMEYAFLKILSFMMAAPTSNQFLRLYMSISSVCVKTENLAQYVAELSLLEIDPFQRYTPSMVAASAYCLAAYTVNQSLWPDSLKDFTGYTMAEIIPCLKDLHNLYMTADDRPQQAIANKYKSSKWCRVSLITPPAALPFQ